MTLEYIEINPKTPAKYSVIWLHGLGADGHDFASIVPQLHLPDNPGIRFIFPHAPQRPVTLNQGMVMRAWFDLASLDFNMQADTKGIDEASEQCCQLIQNEIKRGIPSKNIFLAGFSQGGVIALHCGLRHPEKLAGIIALSTFLPTTYDLSAHQAHVNKNTPIFIGHGKFDTMIPLSWAKELKSMLEKENYQVEWHSYPIDHSVSMDEIKDISHFLQKI